MYLQYYLMGIILLPGIILALYAQSKVNTTFTKYNKIAVGSSITASDLIKRLLTIGNLNQIQVKRISGHLSDHYNPKTEEINLSNDVYASNSISALGIACHEFGHALQKQQNYFPYVLRKTLAPITSFASYLLWPLVIVGLIFNFGTTAGGITGNIFLWSGIGLFGLAVLFSLVTLPVEFDASKRAVAILKSSGIMTDSEIAKTKEVLNAAALTYVAALVVAILNLLRFLSVFFLNRRQ